MKISKKRLKVLIENYLFEQEEGPESKKDKDSEAVKVKPMTIELMNKIAKLSINKATGEVTFKVTGGNEESIEVSLKQSDVEQNNDKKSDFVELASGYIQDLRRESNEKAEEFLDSLMPLIDITDATNYKPALVKFDKQFNIRDADSITNSKLA
tara:strand:+ start:678 stop:1139 length:462 start_codon:yes stop_codon:yes gene_type:complete